MNLMLNIYTNERVDRERDLYNSICIVKYLPCISSDYEKLSRIIRAVMIIL